MSSAKTIGMTAFKYMQLLSGRDNLKKTLRLSLETILFATHNTQVNKRKRIVYHLQIDASLLVFVVKKPIFHTKTLCFSS